MRTKLRNKSSIDGIYGGMEGISSMNGLGMPSRGADYWNAMPWKPVDMSSSDLGEFNDCVFMGLEELDGNDYIKKKGKDKKQKKSQESEAVEVVEALELAQEQTEENKKSKKQKKPISESEVKDLNEETVDTSENKSKNKKKRKAAEDTEVTSVSVAADTQAKKKKKTEKTQTAKQPQTKPVKQEVSMDEILDLTSKTKQWDNIELTDMLTESLLALDFQHPTPIQSSSIPVVLSSEEICDVVGIAETGSGKTLAFVLPVIHSIIQNWDYCKSCKSPFAMIISPTRELSMQIASVIKDVATKLLSFAPFLKIKTATVVGGMSEDKQRRLLSTSKQPLHIIIATPGRLNEILDDNYIEAFQDLTQIKYLILDEADRMMEDGHFPELYRIFNRIRDHDEIVRRGDRVADIIRKRREGVTEVTAEEEMNNEDEIDDVPIDYPGDVGNDDDEDNGDEGDGEEEMELVEEVDQENDDNDDDNEPDNMVVEEQYEEPGKSFALQRQTLLFTATGLETDRNKKTLDKSFLSQKQSKKLKLKGTIKGLATDCSLPTAIKELLSVVAIQPTIRVIDVTHDSHGKVDGSNDKSNQPQEKDEKTGKMKIPEESTKLIALPKHLLQFEIRIPTEDKDLYAYYYLLKNEGRTLIFVNSIKTARRLDGLLRALQFHCRTIHGDLPQRQRIKSLETFQSSPRGILVATDIAARGLDIPKISSVIHYDIARTPQVYIHRSGRTARANASGKTISFVTPEDYEYHTLITEYVTGKKLKMGATSSSGTSIQPYRVEPNILPALRDRIQLAKKIFTQSFVLTQEQKEKHWLEDHAEKTDLPFDEYMMTEITGSSTPATTSSSAKKKKEQQDKKNQQQSEGAAAGGGKGKKGGKGSSTPSILSEENEVTQERKKKLQEMRRELARLLETPLPTFTTMQSTRFSSNPTDWRKRKNGFFVYNPSMNLN